jgi:hypothetical protein
VSLFILYVLSPVVVVVDVDDIAGAAIVVTEDDESLCGKNRDEDKLEIALFPKVEPKKSPPPPPSPPPP